MASKEKSAIQYFIDLCRIRGRVCPKQTMVYHQGGPTKGFYRVNSGVVMSYRLLENSQRQILGFHTEGDFFGLSAENEYLDSAVTVTTANIVLLTMSDVAQSETLQKELFSATWKQLNANQSLITTLTKKTALQKVVTFIDMLVQRQQLSGSEYDVRLPMSRLDIADFLGMSIETVSRQLTVLKNDDVIELPKRHIIRVKDPIKLKYLMGSS